MPELKKISEGAGYRTVGRIVGLVQPIVKVNGGLGVVDRREKRRAANEPDRSFRGQVWRPRVRVFQPRAPLVIKKPDSEAWINGRLVRIGERAGYLVQAEPRIERRFVRDAMVHAN